MSKNFLFITLLTFAGSAFAMESERTGNRDRYQPNLDSFCRAFGNISAEVVTSAMKAAFRDRFVIGDRREIEGYHIARVNEACKALIVEEERIERCMMRNTWEDVLEGRRAKVKCDDIGVRLHLAELATSVIVAADDYSLSIDRYEVPVVYTGPEASSTDHLLEIIKLRASRARAPKL